MKTIYFYSLLFILTISCKKHEYHVENSSTQPIYSLSNRAIESEDLNHFIDLKMKEMNIPGLSMAIINDGKLAYHTTKGYAQFKDSLQVTKNTIFEGASISKALFAYMTMFLVEEGKLDLDASLDDYLDPKYRPIFNHDPRYKKITARMVLSHTTGFPNWRGDSALKISFEPGTNFGYSGEGYQYLVFVLYSILNTDYKGLEYYFQEKVAIPLGMKHTQFIQNKDILLRKASGHVGTKEFPVSTEVSQEFGAAYGIHSESLDFSKWLIALLEKKELSKKSYKALFTDVITIPEHSIFKDYGGVEAWALGFSKFNLAGHIINGHGGNNEGFTSHFFIDIEKKWAMVYFANADQVSDFGFDLFTFINKDKE